MIDRQQLDVSSLRKSIISLNESIIEYHKNPANSFVRDAAIHRYKYTYEISRKMLKRYLETTEPCAEEMNQMEFPNLIRTGSERGLLLHCWDIWKIYRNARNITSYTYDENKAVEICGIIPGFLEDSQYLLDQINERIE